MKLISVIVPVYNEELVLEKFLARILEVLESLKSLSLDYEIIFVNDGSSDSSIEILHNWATNNQKIRVIHFSRNFGHQVAISAGIDYAAGDAVAIIDADLQDPPEIIREFVLKWHEGYKVVYGVRKKRSGESRFKLVTAALFYRLLRLVSGLEIPMDTGDFRLIDHQVVEQMRKIREKDRFMRGLVSWVGFRQIGIEYERDERAAGKSKYSLPKMFSLALNGLISFSSLPLKLATWLGYLTSFLAILYGLSVFVQKAMGITVQGWATIMVAILFIGGVQLICLGIIGEYIARIFNEIKNRPLYIIAQAENLETQEKMLE